MERSIRKSHGISPPTLPRNSVGISLECPFFAIPRVAASFIPLQFTYILDRIRSVQSTNNLSHLSFCPTSKISSTCTTAVIATHPSSIKRKTYASVIHCWKPNILRRVVRYACHVVREACFSPYKLLLSRKTVSDSLPQPFGKQTQKNILIGVRLNKSLVYIKMAHIQITLTRNRTQKTQQELDTAGANVSTKSISSRSLKPRATSLDLAFTIYSCSSVFHVYTHFASITFSTGCYTGAKVPACSRPWNCLFIDCRHISACRDASAPETFVGV